MNSKIQLIPLDHIRQDPGNPRGGAITNAEVQDLTVSIEKFGLLHPITVSKDGEGYIVVAGARRFVAIVALREQDRSLTEPTNRFETIPAAVRNFDSALEVFQVQMAENESRVDVALVEKAKAIRRVANEHQLTQDEMAAILSKTHDYVSKLMTVAESDEALQFLLVKHELTLEDAVTLERIARRIPDGRRDSTLKRLARERAAGELSRKQLRDYLTNLSPRKRKAKHEERPARFFSVDSVGAKGHAFSITDSIFQDETRFRSFRDEHRSLILWLLRHPGFAQELHMTIAEAIRASASDVSPDAVPMQSSMQE